MKTNKLISLGVAFAGAGLLAGLLVIRFSDSNKPTAGIKIETDPVSLVFINSVQSGQTPFDRMYPPGNITVRLVPESTSSAVSAYQTTVKLTDKTYTVIRRTFGLSDVFSSGQTISLIPQPSKTASISVLTSDPDSASILIDNEPQGFTPLTVDNVTATDHQININAPGYETISLNAKAVTGYKLSIIAKLAARNQTTPVIPPGLLQITPTATPSASLKMQVRISSTPTGFLRVRSAPNVGSQEIGRVNPGETYPLLATESGWFKIEGSFTATVSGWISSQYAVKL